MDNYIRKILILQFTKPNLMKHLLLISALLFLFSCKKEVIVPPVIPPVVNTDSILLHLMSGGYCDKENETAIQINSTVKLYPYSIDTTFNFKKGDTVTLVSWKASFADCTSENWVMINSLIDSSQTTIQGSSEYYYSARLEYIVK